MNNEFTDEWRRRLEIQTQAAEAKLKGLNLADADLWSERLRELGTFAAQGRNAAFLLAERLFLYKQWYLEALRTMARCAAKEEEVPATLAPWPLLWDMTRICHIALSNPMDNMAGVLLAIYQQTPPEEPGRLDILSLLAKTGDPELFDFFTNLSLEEVKPAFLSEEAYLSESDISEMSVDDIEEKVDLLLANLKATYLEKYGST
jgi:hypothetical protein